VTRDTGVNGADSQPIGGVGTRPSTASAGG